MNRGISEQAVNGYRPFLGDPVRPVGGLVFNGRVPPGIYVDGVIGGGQVQSEAATSATQINLSWSDNATGETGYKVERKTGRSTIFSLTAPSYATRQ